MTSATLAASASHALSPPSIFTVYAQEEREWRTGRSGRQTGYSLSHFVLISEAFALMFHHDAFTDALAAPSFTATFIKSVNSAANRAAACSELLMAPPKPPLQV